MTSGCRTRIPLPAAARAAGEAGDAGGETTIALGEFDDCLCIAGCLLTLFAEPRTGLARLSQETRLRHLRVSVATRLSQALEDAITGIWEVDPGRNRETPLIQPTNDIVEVPRRAMPLLMIAHVAIAITDDVRT